jgi:hypothetical protein
LKDGSDVEVEGAVVHTEAWSYAQQRITIRVVISTLGFTLHTALLGLHSSLVKVFLHVFFLGR